MGSDAARRPSAVLAAARHRVTEAGNTLVLFPVAVLIVLGLAALALDAATIFLGQRRLVDLAAAVADDGVAAIDLASYYDPDRPLALDADRVRARRDQLVAGAGGHRSLEEVDCRIDAGGLRVTATCSATVRPLFAPLWPGAPGRRTVTASETAVGVRG